MPISPLILSIDQGTSGTKALLVDEQGQVVARGYAPLTEQHPHPGWVEQRADEVWNSVLTAVQACLQGQEARHIAALGLSTQREAYLLWDRLSGQPVSPLLSWQDRRTAQTCAALRQSQAANVREQSGLPLDPMFSALKGQWLLDAYDPQRQRAKAGELCLGTVDSWLLFHLTGQHVTELGNASRTQLLNIHSLDWDEELLGLFGIPRAALPELRPSDGPFGTVRGVPGLLDGLPMTGVMGDSHAALFAHGQFTPGTVKATYGTGSSIMALISQPETLDPGLCLTVAWSRQQQGVQYAAEGNIRAAGATLRWLAELLGSTPAALAKLAAGRSASPVKIVPAFGGLGAPYWDEQAVGLISNLSLGTAAADLAYAALDSIAQQVTDVVDAVRRSGVTPQTVFADGGPTTNDQLMQLQADLLGVDVRRSVNPELSALGAAHLAGLTAGVWDAQALHELQRETVSFTPSRSQKECQVDRAAWKSAVHRARGAKGTLSG